jgi:hypothetical protein
VDGGLLAPGRHETVWDGRGENGAPVSAGLYFVALALDGHRVGTKRLTVLR